MKYPGFPLLKRAFFLLLTIIIFFALKVQISKLVYNMNHFLPQNIYVNGTYIGGLTIEEALHRLDLLEQVQQSKSITILYDDGLGLFQSSSYIYSELGGYANKESVAQQLYSIMNKKSNILKRFWRYRQIENSSLSLSLPFNIDQDKFMDALRKFDDSKLKQPVDAKLKCSDGKVQITPEEYGYVYDKETIYKELIKNPNFTTVKLHLKAVRPAMTTEDIEAMGIKEKIVSFSTRFDGSNAPRVANIKLAAKSIDGTILVPNGIFSFNEVVGDRTPKTGYLEAGIYRNGKVDTGIGGGVCQVSTTLYNAALLTDLEIIERSNHSLTVAYVPLSRDAAVSYGLQDLKFLNNTKHHIYIHSKVTSSTITFEFYSTKSNKKVELISTTISKVNAPIEYINDAAMLIGQEKVIEKGHDGFQSQLVKNTYIDGELVYSAIISKDRYQTSSKIVRRGKRIPDFMLDKDY